MDAAAGQYGRGRFSTLWPFSTSAWRLKKTHLISLAAARTGRRAPKQQLSLWVGIDVQTRRCNICSAWNDADLFSSRIQRSLVARLPPPDVRQPLADEAARPYLSTFHCATAKLAIEYRAKANASRQTQVFHPLASPLNSVFTILAQFGGCFLPRAALGKKSQI